MSSETALATASCTQPEPGTYGRRLCAVAAVVVTVAASAGCGPSGPQRVGVEGRVTIDGRPLPWGAIYFQPEFGVPGPKAGARIEKGTYRIEPDEGPAVGRLRVEIRAEHDADAEHDVGRTAPLPEIVAVPARYNRDSTLVVETTLEGANEFDFDLTSGE